MRIGIDITPVIYGRGVSLYTSNLLRALAELGTQDQLLAFGSSLRAHHHLQTVVPDKVKTSLHRYPPSLLNILFNFVHLPIERLTGPLDVFHAWDWYIPSTKQAKLVSTVHDLALFRFPETAHPQIAQQHRKSLRYLRQVEAQIIAVSEATRDDLIELFDFSPADISVIPEALPEEMKIAVHDSQIATLRSKHMIQGPFLLCVGVNEPRKNFNLIIQAWQRFKADYSLVIAGAEGWGELNLQDKIIVTGSLDRADLAALYKAADVLIYTSLYEGFGLPILEAFYHQTPVVTSNVSSMPEVAGQAAILVEPSNPEAIADGIEKALNQSLKLISKGKERLQHFSWQHTAQLTLQLYKKSLI